MHDAAFTWAALPQRFTVLRLTLRPLSLGHYLWLTRRQSPFIAGGELTFHELAMAALICSQTHAQIEQMDHDRFLGLKTRLWLWLNRNARLADEIHAFKTYFAAGLSFPPTKAVKTDETPRVAGAPFILRLIQFLHLKMGVPLAAVYDFPLGLAQWHWCAFWEGERALRIKNLDETEEDLIDEFVRGKPVSGENLAEAKRKARAICRG